MITRKKKKKNSSKACKEQAGAEPSATQSHVAQGNMGLQSPMMESQDKLPYTAGRQRRLRERGGILHRLQIPAL